MGQMDSRDGIVRYRSVPFITGHSKDAPKKGKFSRQRRGFDGFKPLISVSREITAAKLGQMNRSQVLF